MIIKLSAEVKKLFEKGKGQGFLTLEEILNIFPNAEDRLEELDEFYLKLLEEFYWLTG